MTTAPANGGFTAESEGWVRVRLADDEALSGSDIWVRSGERYPLKVAEYEFPTPAQAPSGLTWLPEDLGGFRRSMAFDEGETSDLSGAIGFYAAGTGSLDVDGTTVSLTIGDFFAGAPSAITFDSINFVTAIYQ